MRVGKRKLRMSSGEIREFKSTPARERFEKYVLALKHGWKPTRKYKKHK